MARYTLIDPVTGEQSILSEAELTHNLKLNCILLRDEEHLGIITHRDLILFARWCAGEMLAKVKGTPAPEAQYALILVDRWLEDELSVSSEGLKAAAQDSFVADAAAGAAGAARAASRAAWAAAGAGEAAWAATGAAWDAGGRGLLYESQAQWLVEHLQSEK